MYATYVTPGERHARLRYRQLRGGTSGGFVDSRSNAHARHPHMAIDSDSNLHVAWLADTTGSSEIAYGNNASSAGDFGPSISYDASGKRSFKSPDIALDSANNPYIVYAYDDGSSDLVKIQCGAAASGCFNGITTRTVPLDAAQAPWRLRGDPRIVVTGMRPTVVFSA